MCCLMYPKAGTGKKRRKHAASIIQEKDGTCFLCSCLHGDTRRKKLERHHIFYGPNRAASEQEGLTVYLCRSHHQYAFDANPEAIHGNPKSRKTDLFLKQIAQMQYEKKHTREEFMKLIGKNYLEKE